MLNIYSSIIDDNNNVIKNRTKLFISDTDNGNIILCEYGTSFVPTKTGTLFIVDDWLIDQLDKVVFKDGELKVKDGEELIPPVKTEKELQREELLKQLAELDSQPLE